MAVVRPAHRVVVNGNVVPALEVHAIHSVEAGIGQCSLVFPTPLNANVFIDARVRVEIQEDDTTPMTPVFVGRIRGPESRQLNESDKAVTVRASGNLWRLTMRHPYNLAWMGPITPRKVLLQLFAFYGIVNAQVEQFVHPTTGVPIILGGVPWFDGGQVILQSGTTPFAFADRLCRLFGYRVFDRPSGRPRVARVSGPPPSVDHTLTEGVDILVVNRSMDLHELITEWEAHGASGTDLAGRQVAVISRSRRGRKSRFVPNPPKYIMGPPISDNLLVNQPLADAARISAEIDNNGVTWRLQAEVIGAPRYLENLTPRHSFRVNSPSVNVNGKRFWQTSIAHDFTEGGYWTSIEGWLPTGRPRATAPPDDPTDPRDPPDDPDTELTPPGDVDLDPWPDIEDPEFEPLPPTFDVDPADPGYVPSEDPDYDPTIPGGWDPTYPGGPIPGDPTDPPGVGLPIVNPDPFVPPPPIAPPVICEVVQLQDANEEAAMTDATPAILSFTPPRAADTILVAGEALGTPTPIQLWQTLAAPALISFASATGGGADWTPFTAELAGPLVATNDAELHIYGTGAGTFTDATWVQHMDVDATKGVRVVGSLVANAADEVIVGFSGTDGLYQLRVDPLQADRAAELVTPAGTTPLGTATITGGEDVAFRLCWDPVAGTLSGSVAFGGVVWTDVLPLAAGELHVTGTTTLPFAIEQTVDTATVRGEVLGSNDTNPVIESAVRLTGTQTVGQQTLPVVGAVWTPFAMEFAAGDSMPGGAEGFVELIAGYVGGGRDEYDVRAVEIELSGTGDEEFCGLVAGGGAPGAAATLFASPQVTVTTLEVDRTGGCGACGEDAGGGGGAVRGVTVELCGEVA